MLVRAYRNLNKRESVVYSTQTRERNDAGKLAWKVTGYCACVFLEDATMKHATPHALQRVRTGAREVCQWVQGESISSLQAPIHDSAAWRRLLSDPKTADGFRDAETGDRIESARLVMLNSDGAFYVRSYL